MDTAGVVLAVWSIGNLRLVESVGGDVLQITSDDAPDARLIVEDPAFSRRLETMAPELRHSASRGRTMWGQIGLIGGLLACLVLFAVYGVPRLAGPIAAAVPTEWEVRFGDRVKTGLLAGEPPCMAREGRVALERLVARLTANIAPPQQIDVAVAKIGMLNAFALPGGYIVVTEKLLETVDSAEELAGVLAHEIGHVVEHHPMEGVVRAVGFSLLFDLMVGGGTGVVDTLATAGGILLAISHTRDDEREADRIGVEMLRQARIDPDGLASFFRRLKEEYGALEEGTAGRVLAFISTHPPFTERIQNTKSENAPAARPALSDIEWLALKAICE